MNHIESIGIVITRINNIIFSNNGLKHLHHGPLPLKDGFEHGLPISVKFSLRSQICQASGCIEGTQYIH